MNKILSILAVVLTLGLSTVAMDAEAAKRMGSGKSMGTQRQATADKAPAAPAQASAAAAGTGAGAGAAAAAAPKRSWMGPMAGLAAGLGLAALASHLGLGDELASMLMIGLLVAAVTVAIGFFMRKRAAANQSMAKPAGAGMQYATLGAGGPTAQPSTPAYKVSMPSSGGSMIGSALGASPTYAQRLPVDFDAAAFERNAKVNFIRLQAANDAGNLDDIRQFTTPEMFAELKMELAERGDAVQKHEVLSINAEVVEVEEGAERYVVSVRFTGVMRDGSAEPEESFDEIWHLMKPRQGNTGWVLSGIQQTN